MAHVRGCLGETCLSLRRIHFKMAPKKFAFFADTPEATPTRPLRIRFGLAQDSRPAAERAERDVLLPVLLEPCSLPARFNAPGLDAIDCGEKPAYGPEP